MLKALGATSTASQEPASLDYWKRESLVYQSGLLDNLPGDWQPRGADEALTLMHSFS
jgi:hypothetical protein